MDKLGTWLAITGVAIGFIVLGWLLFSENPLARTRRSHNSNMPTKAISASIIIREKRRKQFERV